MSKAKLILEKHVPSISEYATDFVSRIIAAMQEYGDGEEECILFLRFVNSNYKPYATGYVKNHIINPSANDVLSVKRLYSDFVLMGKEEGKA